MVNVEVRIHGKLVAELAIYNISDLSDYGNYEFCLSEFGCRDLNIPPMVKEGTIASHYRKQSVWNLIRQVLLNAEAKEIDKEV